jgi:hypothetical protein
MAFRPLAPAPALSAKKALEIIGFRAALKLREGSLIDREGLELLISLNQDRHPCMDHITHLRTKTLRVRDDVLMDQSSLEERRYEVRIGRSIWVMPLYVSFPHVGPLPRDECVELEGLIMQPDEPKHRAPEMRPLVSEQSHER